MTISSVLPREAARPDSRSLLQPRDQ